MTDLMAWIDLETTGLTDDNLGGLYAGGDILELGIIVTTVDLTEVARESWLYALPHRPHAWWRRCGDHCTRLANTVSPEVRSMHERSGLWAELLAASGDAWVDPKLGPVAWLDKHAPSTEGSPMCGSSVHFDREWLRHRWGNVEQWFSYRNIDISGIREAARQWWPELYAWAGVELDPQKRHRALPDLEDTLAEARLYRSHLTPTIPARGPVTPAPDQIGA